MTGSEDIPWLRLLLAFSTVAGLLAALGFILKYISMRGFTLPNQPPKTRRMRIVETMPLDTRRRLVIVDCDGREHLLLLSAAQDIVVTSNLPSSSKTP